MRVIAGTAGSLPLKAPEGMNTRPTTDRIRETLFNMLQKEVPGAVFLDLFSGSGAIGIEALSRGAKKAYFVEKDPKALDIIEQNLTFTKLKNRAILIKQDVVSALCGIREEAADIIFMDPPYRQDLERPVLACLGERPFVTPDTLVIVEAYLGTDFSYAAETGFCVVREKKYKTNKHVFLRKTGGQHPGGADSIPSTERQK